MAEIIFKQRAGCISCSDGDNLMQVLLDAGIFVDNPCSGKGLCGKCKVRVLSGNPSVMSDTEKKLLKQEEIVSGVRLSCLTEVSGHLEIELLQKEGQHKVLTKGYIPEFDKDSFEEGYGICIE